MNMVAIQQLFSDSIIQAFCWTLVHSLWQGLLMAILGGLLVLITRKAAPSIRYNLFSILFILFFLAAGTTFLLEWQAASKAGEISGSASAGGPVVSPVNYAAGFAAPGKMTAGNVSDPGTFQRLTERFIGYFDEHAPLVVLIWFILFSAQFARMLANLGKIHRIRNYRTTLPSLYWQERIGELAVALGIKRKIALLESAIIKVPMMAGVLKPVILIPLGLLAQLPADQVEAVLLHELAHIRRKDYFMNLLQSFGETLFFFNPGVRWISALIREERENCCDDIALGVAKSKKQFIHALVSFQEYNLTVSKFAIAFPGSGNHLLQRVRRIVYKDNKMLDIREKCFLLVCVFIIGGLTLAFSHAEKAPVPTPVQASLQSALAGVGKVKASGADAGLASGAEQGFAPGVGRYPIADIDQGMPSAIVQSSAVVQGSAVLQSSASVVSQASAKAGAKNMVDTRLKFVNPILTILLSEKIIRDTAAVSFDLCKYGIVVNGVRQSAAVAKPLQAQYIANPKNRIKYSKTSGGHETTLVTEIK
jgi:bla regulator protein blaR1